MICIFFFLTAVAFIAAGFAWLADRPGDIVLTFMGYRIETSLMVAVIGVVLMMLIAIVLWSILRAIVRSPEQVSLFFRHRRAMKGYLAISRGLIAVASGDLRVAQRSAGEAERLSPDDPLTLLLAAQSAQLGGHRASAERAFHKMTQRDETKLLGLRGLYMEARRRNDASFARRAAEQAAKAAPSLPWAGQAVLDDRCMASDWSGALAALENMKAALNKNIYWRRRAVLLTAQAIASEECDRDASQRAALEATKLAPDLVPAVALAGRQLAEKGEQRKARRILEKAWVMSPHPDLAEAYANLRPGDSARERLDRMQKLSELTPGGREAALAVARAALDAGEFATARAALAPYLSLPTRRLAMLMAEIEDREHGDHGRVREWMSRAMHASGDPIWTADGVVSEHWMPVAPNGQLDGFVWRAPLAEIASSHSVIEPIPAAIVSASATAMSVSVKTPGSEENEPNEADAPDKTRERDASVRPQSQPATDSPTTNAARDKATEPVIPLVHLPDDPGPLSNAEEENTDAPSSAARPRFRQGFP